MLILRIKTRVFLYSVKALFFWVLRAALQTRRCLRRGPSCGWTFPDEYGEMSKMRLSRLRDITWLTNPRVGKIFFFIYFIVCVSPCCVTLIPKWGLCCELWKWDFDISYLLFYIYPWVGFVLWIVKCYLDISYWPLVGRFVLNWTLSGI